MVDADAYALLATRSALAQRTGAPVPLDAVLTALLVPVLKDHPAMNAMLDGDEIVYFDRYDIGIAVDTPGRFDLARRARRGPPLCVRDRRRDPAPWPPRPATEPSNPPT